MANKEDKNKLIEEIFMVTDIDPKNKTPFRNVSRVHMKSEYSLTLELDINTQIYPIHHGMKLFIKTMLSESSRNAYTKEEQEKLSESNNYDYVMYGSVFEIEDHDDTMAVFASFGGLIMRMKG